MLMEVINQLDGILFDDYVKRKSADVAKIIRTGVLGGMVDWYEAPKPTEVHPFIYDALLSLVLVHAQVSETARPLVARTLGSLVEELARVSLEAFSKVERFGMGGMLQATLEIEFMHQTLSQHVSPVADETLQSIYKTISRSYYRKPTANSSGELQQELEGLKRTLVSSRRATALQFLAFRKVKERTAESVISSVRFSFPSCWRLENLTLSRLTGGGDTGTGCGLDPEEGRQGGWSSVVRSSCLYDIPNSQGSALFWPVSWKADGPLSDASTFSESDSECRHAGEVSLSFPPSVITSFVFGFLLPPPSLRTHRTG